MTSAPTQEQLQEWLRLASADLERLEFLGDAVLDLVVSDDLFQRWPEASEADLTYMRASLVCTENLSVLASQLLHLEDGLYGDRELANTFEALVGVVFTREGYDRCRDCLLQWLQLHLQATHPDTDYRHPKNKLQEFLQSIGEEVPNYSPLSSTLGDARVACEFIREGVPWRIEVGARTLRLAETQAAEQALRMLDEGISPP